MKRTLKQFLDLLLFSNIFIALCAVAQAMVTYQLLDARPDTYMLGFLFFATLAMYNYSILLAKPKNPDSSKFRRVRWIFSHYRLTITITIIAVFSLIPLSLFLSTTSLILLSFLAFFSITYNLPIFSIGGKKFGIRNIPGIKLFLIASIWALSCVLLPIIELESRGLLTVSTEDTILLVAKRFLFVAAITVPFDIRDLFEDKRYELRTIPVILGERKAYILCLLLLVIYVILLFLFNNHFDLNFVGLTITVIITAWLIFKSEWERNEYYYFLVLDGTLILQCIVLMICRQFER